MYINDEKINCRYDRDNDRFSYRVGAIIVEDGAALLATNDSVDCYYSIGGGVFPKDVQALISCDVD